MTKDRTNTADTFLYSKPMNDETKTLQALENENARLKAVIADNQRFIKIIAHDLRNPVGSLVGFADVLLKNYDNLNEEKVIKILATMKHVAAGSHNLLQDLLLWSKSHSGQLIVNEEIIEFGELCENLFEKLKYPAVRKQIEFECRNDISSPLFADERMLCTVIRNLLSNAVKFSRDGGKVIVSARQNADFTEIKVQDFGIGMSKVKLATLWDDSATLNSTKGTNNENGAGIGLTLCREFADRLGGTISAESEEGAGSCFKLRLPLSKSS